MRYWGFEQVWSTHERSPSRLCEEWREARSIKGSDGPFDENFGVGVAAAQRHDDGNRRDEAADERDEAAEQRDEAAALRDEAGNDRDGEAETRDGAGGLRDRAARHRDVAAVCRDVAAEQRDRLAGAVERTQAGDDRDTALADRGSGATARVGAEADRESSHTDRDAGAEQRVRAAGDRGTSTADRDSSATDLALALLDGLTGVLTRGAGLLALQREIERARRTRQPLALTFVDVDGLKAINDSGGHAAGDRVLVRVARALMESLRPYDRVIRYGGDEFLCVCAGASGHDVAQRVQGVNATLAEGPVPTTMSLGSAALRSDDTLETLVGRADDDLYRQRQHI